MSNSTKDATMLGEAVLHMAERIKSGKIKA